MRGGNATSVLTSISGRIVDDDDELLLPPPDLPEDAHRFWRTYIVQRELHSWSDSAREMLKRLCQLCALYEKQYDKLLSEDPVSVRANGSPCRNPRWNIVGEILHKIGTLETYLQIQSAKESAAARSAKLVAITRDEDGLLQ